MPTTWRDRLRAALDEKEWTVAELCRRADQKPTAWTDMMDRGQKPAIEKLAAFVNALGKSLDEVYYGTDSDALQLTITGACVGGGDMWEPVSPQTIRSVPIRLISDDIVTVSVDTSDYEPEYRRGDVLCGPRMGGKHLDNLIGRDCVVVTKEGDRLVKALARGSKPGRYTLRSMHRNVDDLVDVRLEWAAPIQMILRGVS